MSLDKAIADSERMLRIDDDGIVLMTRGDLKLLLNAARTQKQHEENEREFNAKVEECLDSLRGPRAEFRKAITDKDKLLGKCMDYFEYLARKRRLHPWSIVGEVTDHGSGVSSAIYELYRTKESKP